MSMATGGWMKYAAIFVGVVVLFTALAELYPEAASAGDQLNESNMCSSAGCFYNASRTSIPCTANNLTSADTTTCSTAYGSTGFPLSGLFAGAGVLFVILAAGVLIFVIKRK